MGADIHYIFQAKKLTGEWETLDLDTGYHFDREGDYKSMCGEYHLDRHYLLFAVLAGVRNGFGFAGAYRHEPLVPIAQGRGLPNGIKSKWIDDDYSLPYGFDDGMLPDEKHDLGEHSFNWLLGSEIMEWFSVDRIIHIRGVITRSEYAEWDRVSELNSYCSDVYGNGLRVYDEVEEILPFRMVECFRQFANVTHVRVQFKESVNERLKYFTDMIQKLMNKYGEIRMVMGFDS